MTEARGAAGGIPLLRTLDSPRFRLLLAALLAILGVALNVSMARILIAGGGIALEDFVPYFAAALRMADGESPYLAEQLAGPVPAICHGCYLYPPLLAQLLVPFTSLPLDTAKVLWLALLSGAAFGSAWIGAGIGGATRSLERLLWTIAATAWFLPVFHSNYLGNVGSLVALGAVLVALGGVAGGVGAASLTWLKVSPLAYVPVALFSDARSRITVVVALLVLLLPSVLLAPSAWQELPEVLWNLVRGSGDTYLNLAPAAMARNIGWSETAVTLVRGLTLAGGVTAMLGAMWMARRPTGLPLATLLATVTMLLVPGTLWYHYLAVLLPLAAMAWPRSGAWLKAALLGGATVTSLAGLAALPIGL
ncbi:MAG: glycosyltransferase 87 family protein, partial [Candidatus Limnocylindrales bacterium]